MTELVAGSVWPRARSQQVEVGVFVPGYAAQGVGVAGAVSFAVVRPGLDRAVGRDVAGQVAFEVHSIRLTAPTGL